MVIDKQPPTEAELATPDPKGASAIINSYKTKETKNVDKPTGEDSCETNR